MNWENEISAKNIERILSISFQLQNVNSFEKSLDSKPAVAEEKIEKSGQEIKERLFAETDMLRANKKSNLDRMGSLVKSIGYLPTGSIDRALIKGFEITIGDLPKQYSLDQIHSDLQKSVPMREFNQVAGVYVRGSVEELKLQTVIANIADDRIVILSKSLVDQLGF
jgi:hypothetical protein